jgi:pimeloyl-ACP methyl ester carboxylesterase
MKLSTMTIGQSRKFFAAICLLAVATAPGCGAFIQHDARQIVEPASMPAKLVQHTFYDDDDLLRSARISLHESMNVWDGTKIDYWVIRHRRSSPSTNAPGAARGTVVLIHPLLTSKHWFLPLGERLAGAGFDVVLPDMRAHGRSGGKYITWGAKEKLDIKSVMDRLIAGGTVSDKIYVCGASMGGCIAIQYAAIEPRCHGVLAICSPAGAREVAQLMLPLCHGDALNARIEQAGKLADFNPADASAITAASRLRCSLLLAHGYWDFVVPYSHSEAIFNAAPEPKKLVPCKWSGHMSIQVYQDDWIAEQIENLVMMGQG